jgi:hypothetical protein
MLNTVLFKKLQPFFSCHVKIKIYSLSLLIHSLFLTNSKKYKWKETKPLTITVSPPTETSPYICFTCFVARTVMHQSILALPIPPPPGTPRAFALFFCPGAGHWYLQSCPGGGELFTGREFDSTGRFCDEHRRTRAIIGKMASKNSRVKTRILSIFSFTKRHTNRTWEAN